MTIRELRESLTPEDIKRILGERGVEPHYENNSSIIFPTVCHNPVGQGSNKLYYYKNSMLFRCFTECCSTFDIFDLIIKMEGIKGNKIGKLQAIYECGFELSSREIEDIANDSLIDDIAFINEVMNSKAVDTNNLNLEPIDPSFLDERYVFDISGLQPWLEEHISINSMLRYGITYDPIENCVVIPHYDAIGNVVGVRGRFMEEDASAKYRPISYNGQILKHPTSETLYGLYQNKSAIRKSKLCVIFEAEKSVLMMDTIYGKNNVAVAVSGQNISPTHIQLLYEAGVSDVIIAFDADYNNYETAKQKLKEYRNLSRPLLAFFNVSIIIDFHGRLGFKDSPIDRGETIFNELMTERVFI